MNHSLGRGENFEKFARFLHLTLAVASVSLLVEQQGLAVVGNHAGERDPVEGSKWLALTHRRRNIMIHI